MGCSYSGRGGALGTGGDQGASLHHHPACTVSGQSLHMTAGSYLPTDKRATEPLAMARAACVQPCDHQHWPVQSGKDTREQKAGQAVDRRRGNRLDANARADQRDADPPQRHSAGQAHAAHLHVGPEMRCHSCRQHSLHKHRSAGSLFMAVHTIAARCPLRCGMMLCAM